MSTQEVLSVYTYALLARNAVCASSDRRKRVVSERLHLPHVCTRG